MMPDSRIKPIIAGMDTWYSSSSRIQDAPISVSGMDRMINRESFTESNSVISVKKIRTMAKPMAPIMRAADFLNSLSSPTCSMLTPAGRRASPKAASKFAMICEMAAFSRCP